MTDHDTVLVSGVCRRCGATVQTSAQGPHVVRCMAECARCCYRTIVRDDAFEVPFATAFAPLLSVDEVTALVGARDNLVHAFMEILERCVARIEETVERERPVVVAGMLQLLDRCDSKLEALFTDPKYSELGESSWAPVDVAICQALYLLLRQRGPIVLPNAPVDEERVSEVVGRGLFPQLGNLVTIAKVILPSLRDRLTNLSWREADGVVVVEKGEQHALRVEGAINMLLREQRVGRPDSSEASVSDLVDSILSSSAHRALALATGVEVDLLAELLAGRMQGLVEQRVAARRGRAVYVLAERLSPKLGVVFRKLSLACSTLERFCAPGFFDTGPARVPAASMTELFIESLAVNWTAYYPCYLAQSPVNGSVIHLTTPRLWQGLLVSLAQRPAYALHQAEEMVARQFPKSEKLPELKDLIRATHRAAEECAGRSLTAAGWQCRTGVDRLDDKPLPPGEIDLLATANVSDACVIVVAEVKNSDAPMVLPGFEERIAELVRRASEQLDRKGAWVAEHWDDALALLDKGASAASGRRLLVRVVVTARPLPPPLFQQFPGASLGELESLAHDLMDIGHDVWKSPWRVHVQELAA